MKTLLFLLLIATNITYAHEGGHGPTSNDTGKFGGIMANVLDEADFNKGLKNKVYYKAELVRSENNEVFLYLYDHHMHLVNITKFNANVQGFVEYKKDNKFERIPFALSAQKKHFKGHIQEIIRRPFNLDFIVTEGNKKFITSFENLD